MKNVVNLPLITEQLKPVLNKYMLPDEEIFEASTEEDQPQTVQKPDIFLLVTKSAGLVLLFSGLLIGFIVILEAFSLYNDPVQIERFAEIIELGSNIDKVIPQPDQRTDSFRLSYFAAWSITLLLLMLISMIAFTAVRTGGELVLYELKIKQSNIESP